MSHRLGFKPAFVQAFLFWLSFFEALTLAAALHFHAAMDASISPSGSKLRVGVMLRDVAVADGQP
ncbi:hypothetical protein CR51_27705 [Caballeronia megalochromosomata]|nr:hypothetical protein CR51_27705 [Caballeronia megalochromosomata]